eukprot:GFYU01007369.1.p1 GENE.GFYU01007369.1~~GFYU01007369.1.p1  ORF type:complete len:788 (-),score=235.39 GFYU01007369.1:56-2419(-)
MDKKKAAAAAAKDMKSSGATGKMSRQSNRSHRYSRSNMSKSSLRSGKDHGGKVVDKVKGVVVRDEEGIDVTPLPLLATLRKRTKEGDDGHDNNSSHSSLSGMSSHSVLSDWGGEVSNRMFGSSSLSIPDDKTNQSADHESDTGNSTDNDEPEKDPETSEPRTTEQTEAKEAVVEDKPEELTEDQLDADHTVKLWETDTFFLLDIQGYSVGLDSEYAEEVKDSNKRFEELRKFKAGNDMYVDRGAQTFNNAPKVKDVQVNPNKTSEVAVEASDWDIYDAFTMQEWEAEKRKQLVKIEQLLPELPDADAKTGEEKVQLAPETEALYSLAKTKDFKWSLQVIDRALMQNVYHEKHMDFRDWTHNYTEQELEAARERTAQKLAGDTEVDNEAVEDEDEDDEDGDGLDDDEEDVKTPTLAHLWGYQCNLTENRNVSCFSWNTKNRDMLAVGYGEFDFTKQADGLILFWSLKNPEFPEHSIRTPYGITALAFSQSNPNLLAAGLYDGSVCIYDVRMKAEKPSLISGHASGKHSDPVWELQWVSKANEGRETLVSISTDGRVTRWSLKKGLEFADLMKLKRVTSQAKNREGKSEGFISRKASGLCLDFYPKDSNIYITGTEDGNIHKCSCSYNEQYLESYYGHAGPVYKVRWSPFLSQYFLSCSADWTIKLWHMDKENPVLSFASSKESIVDIAWSPTNATVFASVNADGVLNIWDLSNNLLDPVTSFKGDASSNSCVMFAQKTPVVMTGDNSGSVNVFKILNVEEPPATYEEQVTRFEEALAPSTQKKGEQLG